MRRTVGTVTSALLALAVGLGCGLGTDPDGEGANVVDPDTESSSDPDDSGGDSDQDPPDSATGTRENPLAPGTAFVVGDWTVEFSTTDTDADDVVAAENQFNDPPADGRRFVLAEITVTYTGEESGTPWVDLTIEFYGSGGNTFGTGSDDFCGVIPDDLSDHGEMFPDATATGNVCKSVPIDQIEDGAWIVEDLWSLNSDRTFVALQ